MMSISYWQRILCGALGALATLCFTAALRYDGHDWLAYIGVLLVVMLLPIKPFFSESAQAAADLFHTYAAGVKARSTESPYVMVPATDAAEDGQKATFGVA